MRRLPLAFRCDRRWAEMEGGSVVRRCGDCGCNVVNLSTLDELTAESLLQQQTATVCVQYRYKRGKMVFARAPRAWAIAAAAAVMLATSAPAVADASQPTPPAPAPSPRRREKPREKKRRDPPAPKKADDEEEYGGILYPRF